MKKMISEAKTVEEAIAKLLEENNLKSDDILYTKSIKKGHLLKSETVVITAYQKNDLLDSAKEFLKEIALGLSSEIKCEILKKEERSVIKIYSENNAVLIGKNGQTIKALETLVRQKIQSETGVNFKVTVDVENYREKRDESIIRLAKKTAKEVLETKVPVTLDSMTSYERRLVHSALSEFKGIKTHSEGEEPNRYTIIEAE